MKKAWVIILLLISAVFGLTRKGWADKAYVTDSFEITLRTGPTTGNKIMGMLSSGQAVDVVSREGEWSFVRLPGDDKEGWVVSRYLINRLPWELQAKALQEELARLRTKAGQTEKDFSEASRQSQDLTAELKHKTQELDRLQKEHSELQRGAEGYLKLKALNAATEKNLAAAQKELINVAAENEKLRSSQQNKWFLYGALVLLCGLLIGTLIGRQQKRRKSSFYD
jgi:SH3 domain protein